MERRSTWGLAIVLVALTKVSVANGQSFPSQCATADSDHNMEVVHWTFQNNCPFTVYWTVQCGVGAQMCFGAGHVSVRPGASETRNMPPGKWEIDGPFRQ